jgi:hypothetical protein
VDVRVRSGWVLYLLALWVVLVGWALASPVGSSPDDDYHLPSIWCAGGVSEGVCSDQGVDDASLAVPAAVATAQDCYRFDASIPGTCADDLVSGSASDSAGAVLQPTDRVNAQAGLYPDGFYSFLHLFIGPDIERSVDVMRIANATLAVAALAWVIALATPSVRRATVIATAVVWIPLGLSILPSTNPSSWAFTGLMLLTAMAFTLPAVPDVRSARWRLTVLGAGVGAFMAISARVDATAYVVIVAIVACVLAGWRTLRDRWPAGVLLVLIAVWGVVAYLLGPTPGGAETGAPMGAAERGIGLLLTNVTYIGVYVQGVVGGWPLSWNDVTLPPSIPIIGTLALGAVLALGMRAMSRRKSWALAVSAAALVTVPLVFLQREGLGVGDVVQPRYIAPLLLLVITVVLLDKPPMPRAVMWTLVVGLAWSASVSWWVFTHRFAYGSDVGWFDAQAIAPFTLAWLVVSVSGLAWLILALRPVGEQTRSPAS